MKKVPIMLLALLFLLCSCAQDAEETVAVQTQPATTEAAVETTPPTTEPMGYEDYYQLGLVLVEEKQWEDAVAAFGAAIALEDSHPEAYLERGSAANRTRTQAGYALAKEDFEAVLALDDTLAEAYLGLADTYIRMEDFDSALAVLQGATEKTQDAAIPKKLAEVEAGDIRDSGGRIYFRSVYNTENGRRICYFVYHYYPDSKDYSITSYTDAGQQIDFAECLHDDQGRAIQTVTLMLSDGKLSEVKQVYDEKGNCVRRESYDENGNLKSYSLRSFDEQGNEIRIENYRADGSMTMYTTNTYNEAGQCTEFHQYDPDDTLTNYWLYTYNTRGQEISTDMYDANGNLTERWVTEYDEEGKKLSLTIYNAQGEVTTYTDYTK